MDLYLIRHADALPVGQAGITADEDRPLSEEGKAQAKALAAALRRQGVQLDKVVTSPLLRARQTAEGMLLAWGKSTADLHPCNELAPGGKRGKLARFLRELGGKAIALVGHQPDLGECAAWLIGSKKARIEMAKGGVAYIISGEEPAKGSGTLVWLATPAWFGE
jgi:phosphohistidine phosphatase